MRRVAVSSIEQGVRLARSLYDGQGHLLAKKGVRLDPSMGAKLERFGVETVFVAGAGFENIDCSEPVSTATFARARETMSSLVDAVRKGNDPGAANRDLTYVVHDVTQDLSEADGNCLLLNSAADEVQNWTVQAINTAFLGALILKRLGVSRFIADLVWAALLKDVGAWCLGPTFRKQVLAETEHDENGQEHVEYSLNILSRFQVSSFVAAAVAQHHECVDGSGYPQGLAGGDIHLMSQVLAVSADYIHQVQHPQEPLSPRSALESVLAGSGFEFDRHVVSAFRDVLYPYPVGTEVELTNGERGVVAGFPGPFKSRPLVRVLFDKAGHRIQPYELDLSSHNTMQIDRQFTF